MTLPGYPLYLLMFYSEIISNYRIIRIVQRTLVYPSPRLINDLHFGTFALHIFILNNLGVNF